MRTEPLILKDPCRDPQEDLVACADAIRRVQWWKQLGLEEHWPLSTEEVSWMLSHAGQYAIDADGLAALVEKGIITPPAGGDWLATDVIEATRVLHDRRQWKPTPSAHDPMKHPHQLLAEQCMADGTTETALDGPFDLRGFLVNLVEIQEREGREKLYALLQVYLHHHGIQL